MRSTHSMTEAAGIPATVVQHRIVLETVNELSRLGEGALMAFVRSGFTLNETSSFQQARKFEALLSDDEKMSIGYLSLPLMLQDNCVELISHDGMVQIQHNGETIGEAVTTELACWLVMRELPEGMAVTNHAKPLFTTTVSGRRVFCCAGSDREAAVDFAMHYGKVDATPVLFWSFSLGLASKAVQMPAQSITITTNTHAPNRGIQVVDQAGGEIACIEVGEGEVHLLPMLQRQIITAFSLTGIPAK